MNVQCVTVGDSKALLAPINWKLRIQLPNKDEKFKSRFLNSVEICNVDTDHKGERMFFTVYPVEMGIYTVNLKDIEEKAKSQSTSNAELTNISTKKVDVRLTSSLSTSVLQQMSTAERNKTHTNNTNWKYPTSTKNHQPTTFSQSSSGKIGTLHQEKLKADNSNETIKAVRIVEPSVQIGERQYRWFLDVAIDRNNLLFVCHRNRPSSEISVYHFLDDCQSLSTEYVGQIKLDDGAEPQNCSILENFGDDSDENSYLLVLGQHFILVLKVALQESHELKWEIVQTISTSKGKEDGDFNFPVSCHFEEKSKSLWIADGKNARIQCFEYDSGQNKPHWNHRWTSPIIGHTVMPQANMAISTNLHDRSKPDKKLPGWVRSVCIPHDHISDKPYIIVSLSECELVCFGHTI